MSADVAFTLNTVERHAVAFAQNQRNEVRDLHDCAGALAAEPGMKQQTYILQEAPAAYGGNPACNQGDMAVVFDGTQVTSKTNRSNPQPGAPCHTLASGNADGTILCIGNGQPNQRISAEQAATLTCMHDAPAVCIDCRNHRTGTVSGTLQAKNNGGQSLNFINPVVSNYIVRRLTPRECAKLQGFPPDWCAGLETPDPTDEDIAFWAEVFETHRRIMGKSKKPKSRNQIIKWLRKPRTDSAEWKMWGNGINLQSAMFVLQGLVELTQDESR